jgi:F420-0:gamma-glutamyl ligase
LGFRGWLDVVATNSLHRLLHTAADEVIVCAPWLRGRAERAVCFAIIRELRQRQGRW